MVYALHKFRHYLLDNGFVFYVNLAFVYLVNKPQVFGGIASCLMLFLEYNFKIVYKLGKSHLMANVLSRFPNQAKLVGVLDQTTNAHLLTLQPKWLPSVYDYMLEGMIP
jgi:hypothetical protein